MNFPKRKPVIVVSAAAVLVSAAGLLAFWQLAYGRILPGTHLNGDNLSWKDASSLRQDVAAWVTTASSTPLSFLLDLQTDPPKNLGSATAQDFYPQQLGISFAAESLGSQITAERTLTLDPRTWLAAFNDKTYHFSLTIDQDVLEQQLSNLLDESTAPKNAVIKLENEKVTVTPAVPGRSLDLEAAKMAIEAHYAQSRSEPILLNTTTQPAAITEADLQPRVRQLEAILAAPLVVSVEKKDFKIDSGDVAKWISIDAQGQISLLPQEIERTLTAIAEQVDQPAQPKKIIAGTEIVLATGQDGRTLDRPKTAGAIATALQQMPAQRNVTAVLATTPAQTLTVNTSTIPSNTGRHIVVDLSEQRLYAWNDGTVVRTFLVSGGLTGPTPVGNFSVYNKIKDHVMAGPGYYLPNVPDSMYFTGPYALHGAYWHNNFGNPMSHGCVNLPLNEASWLFDWTPVGTPVHVVG